MAAVSVGAPRPFQHQGPISEGEKTILSAIFFSRFHDFFDKFALSLDDLGQARNYSSILEPVTRDRRI
jgi:hypothetical protein